MGSLSFFLVGHPPVVSNKRWHWGRRQREVKVWKDATIWSVRAAMIDSSLSGDMVPVAVHVEFNFHQRRTRDRDNLVASLKPVIDGLVAARIVRDDGPQWMPDPPFVTEVVQNHRPAGIYVKVIEL